MRDRSPKNQASRRRTAGEMAYMRHCIPDIVPDKSAGREKGTWHRILGLFHKLDSVADRGPVSKIRY